MSKVVIKNKNKHDDMEIYVESFKDGSILIGKQHKKTKHLHSFLGIDLTKQEVKDLIKTLKVIK